MTVAALCRRPDARGSLVDASRLRSLPAVVAVRSADELRAAPASSALRGSVRAGEPVAVERRARGWARVLTDTGATGWLREDALTAPIRVRAPAPAKRRGEGAGSFPTLCRACTARICAVSSSPPQGTHMNRILIRLAALALASALLAVSAAPASADLFKPGQVSKITAGIGSTVKIVDHENFGANEVGTYEIGGTPFGALGYSTKSFGTTRRSWCAGGEVRLELETRGWTVARPAPAWDDARPCFQAGVQSRSSCSPRRSC